VSYTERSCRGDQINLRQFNLSLSLTCEIISTDSTLIDRQLPFRPGEEWVERIIRHTLAELIEIVSQNWEANLSAIEAERQLPSSFDAVARTEATSNAREEAKKSAEDISGKGGKIKAGGKAL